MTLRRPGFGIYACMLLVAGLLSTGSAQAACTDKALRGMADAGRSVSTISKRCGMTVAAVKERLDAGAPKPGDVKSGDAKKSTETQEADDLVPDARTVDGKAGTPKGTRAPSASAASSPSAVDPASKTGAKAAAEPQKHPPGTILELCGCYGSMPYGFTEPNAECLSGKAVATRCPGYCPVNRSPWRRICS
ncbi:hypothetical protein [Achromobacter sp.]|uniref:hypothetical protein n=1 Tax=Achromobacter sp. TaxID=134375 RepID=UPI0028B16066|nr:hypothetical protein [Achromobacter sp.]